MKIGIVGKSRYIDADALLESVQSKRLIFEESTPIEEAIAEQVSVFEEAIEEAPTADVVAVVRCKDCKYITKDQIADEIIDRCVCFGGMIDIAPDGFCSYGERREE